MFVSCPYVEQYDGVGLLCNTNYNSCNSCGIAHPELRHKKEVEKKNWLTKIFACCNLFRVFKGRNRN